MMPMFFFISGASSRLSYKIRPTEKYVIERFKRLIIPYFLGVIVLTPPINYFHELSIKAYSDSFWNYIPPYIQHIFDLRLVLGGQVKYFSPLIFNVMSAHTWYLGYLFIFSLITIPIFKYLSSNSGMQFINRLITISYKPGMILLYFFPLAISNILLKGLFPRYTDWADFFCWFSIFILGFILFSEKAFENIINKNVIISFCSGSISFIIIGLLLQTDTGERWHRFPDYSAGSFFFWTLWTFTTWSWIVFFTAMGIRFLNFKNKFLEYASEALLPICLLHLTIIVTVSYFVVKWNIGMLAKFMIITNLSLIIILLIYELIVKRIDIIRTVFGMKGKYTD